MMGKLGAWEQGRGDGAAASGAVLIDNSTYFSARSLLVENDVNAYTVYNLANLLECLVVTEGVLLSPTVSWSPSPDDPLFATQGVCAKLDFADWDESALARLFSDALAASAADATSNTILETLGYERSTSAPAIRLMSSWQRTVAKAPHEFLSQYSGAVHLTDSASRRFVSDLQTATSNSAPPEYHLAQYLLRSNVAYELSATWAYHPHSHRLRYIADRMRRAQRDSAGLGYRLLQATEEFSAGEISELQRNSILRSLGAFKHEVKLPLILSAVLSQATCSDEVLPIALKLRNERAARRYRHWVGELIAAIDSCDLRRQIRAEAELGAACKNLSNDLAGLYRPPSGATDAIERTAAYAGTFDPSIITDLSAGMATGELLVKGAAAIAGTFPSITDWLRRYRQRRNVVFLLDLSRHRQRVEALNPLLHSVFGSSLDQDELYRLYALRAEQSRSNSIIIESTSK